MTTEATQAAVNAIHAANKEEAMMVAWGETRDGKTNKRHYDMHNIMVSLAVENEQPGLTPIAWAEMGDGGINVSYRDEGEEPILRTYPQTVVLETLSIRYGKGDVKFKGYLIKPVMVGTTGKTEEKTGGINE
jgi:hypothetical protein